MSKTLRLRRKKVSLSNREPVESAAAEDDASTAVVTLSEPE